MIVGETGGYLYPSTVTGFKGKINCLNIGSNAIYIRQGKAPDGITYIHFGVNSIQRLAENRNFRLGSGDSGDGAVSGIWMDDRL